MFNLYTVSNKHDDDKIGSQTREKRRDRSKAESFYFLRGLTVLWNFFIGDIWQ